MREHHDPQGEASAGAIAPPPGSVALAPSQPRGPLAGMRIRKKLIVLHTLFSLTLAAILLVALRPAVAKVIARAEQSQAEQVLKMLGLDEPEARALIVGGSQILDGDVVLRIGTPEQAGLSEAVARKARGSPGAFVGIGSERGRTGAVTYVPEDGRYYSASVRMPEARAGVIHMYALTAVAIIAVYALIALSLEVLVLPRHVYGPISALLRADRAVQSGDRAGELIPDEIIPADEIGQIMRSRNDSILALRSHERRLAETFERLESVATDLRKKNYLLETARRNLEGADRLASLGMMSAGIAHEMNTPLAVAKGLVEKLADGEPHALSPVEAALLRRVVGRLEKVSEGLLDFARARSPESRPTCIREVVDEAITLVRLDREAAAPGGAVEIVNAVPEAVRVECDGDRMIQVFVNLVRNAADALRGRRRVDGPGTIRIEAETTRKDGAAWISIRVIDDGPGIDKDLLPALFEPFVSTRLDARGTGLGLAVSDGIVREHGGVLIASNRRDRSGAVFEVMLPMEASRASVPDERPGDESAHAATSEGHAQVDR